MSQDRSYTIAETAKLTGLHRNTIRMRVKSGQLEAEVAKGKFGDEYRIPYRALLAAGLIPDATTEDVRAAQTPAGEPAETPAEEPVLDAEFTEPGHGPQADTSIAILGNLRDLFERHETSVYRLGYAEAELERTKALAERAESLQDQREQQITEIAQLRAALETAQRDAARLPELERELHTSRRQLAELDALRRDLAALRQEHERLLELIREAEEAKNRPWWRRR